MNMMKLILNNREEKKYIYKIFNYNNIIYLIFYSTY